MEIKQAVAGGAGARKAAPRRANMTTRCRRFRRSNDELTFSAFLIGKGASFGVEIKRPRGWSA